MNKELRELGERAEKIRSALLTEESVKQSLIIPFIKELGFDVYNPLEVVPEFTADVGNKNFDKIDYAIMKDGKPIILIECKHCNEDLKKHGSQLAKYFAAVTVCRKIGILTNGYHYQIFSDLDKPNIKDEKPFFEFDITNLKDRHIEEIKKFHKSALNMDNILDNAEELKYKKELRHVIEEELKKPSKGFIEYWIRRIYDGVLNEKRKGIFEPIVIESIKHVLDEFFTDRLTGALKVNSEKENQQSADNDKTVDQNQTDDLTPNQDEIDAFGIIKAICSEIISPDRLAFKKTNSYSAITVDKHYKAFFRMFGTKKVKYVKLYYNDKTEETDEKHDIQSVADIYAFKNKILECVKTYISQ
jgi:hypothetical protein